MRSDGGEREMAGSSKMERTLRVITKSESILTPLLGEFMRAWLQPYMWRSMEHFPPIKQSIVRKKCVLGVISVQETNKKFSFYLTCVVWSLPVSSQIA